MTITNVAVLRSLDWLVSWETNHDMVVALWGVDDEQEYGVVCNACVDWE